MIDVKNIHSLSDFNRHTKAHLENLKKTGQPMVLTVNGRAEVVVQDAEAYQRLLDQIEYWDTVRVLKERIAARDAGEPTFPAEESVREIMKELGLGAKK
jgi:PHD/YefM family antitoxin component YafN of YafNO toxin-antitoxin module